VGEEERAIARWSYFERRYASTKRRLLNPEQEDLCAPKKTKTKFSVSLFLAPCEKSYDRVFNKTRSVNNADTTALELIYTQRKRHGHVGRA